MLNARRDDEEAFNNVVIAMEKIAENTDDVVADLHEADKMTEMADADTDQKPTYLPLDPVYMVSSPLLPKLQLWVKVIPYFRGTRNTRLPCHSRTLPGLPD